MTLNIPINLVSTTASHTHPTTEVGKSNTTEKVQPTTSAAKARNVGVDGDSKNSGNRTDEIPNKGDTSNTEHIYPSELDRYAPPNPLPTAPILLAATAYAASRKET